MHACSVSAHPVCLAAGPPEFCWLILLRTCLIIESTEDKCEHFTKLVEVLTNVSGILKEAGEGWRISTKEYKKAETVACLDCFQSSMYKSRVAEEEANIRKTVKALVKISQPGTIDRDTLVAMKHNLTQEAQEINAADKLLEGSDISLLNIPSPIMHCGMI